MATLVRREPWKPADWTPTVVLAAVCAVALAALVLAPGDITAKTHHFLHGVCAQRPSHSFALGGTTLPLDARMTGIYTGAATMIAWLLAGGRLGAVRTPPRAVLVLLAGGIIAVAGDGFNALLFDLGHWHPYQPSNMLRLVTGTVGGLTLGAVIGHVFATAFWRTGNRQLAVIARPTELLAPVGIALALTTPATSGLGVFATPYAVGLTAAVVVTFWLMTTAVLATLLGDRWSLRPDRTMVFPAAVGLVLAIAVVGGLALLRFLAEWHLGLPQLT